MPIVSCHNCKKDTSNPRFCSRRCSAIVSNKKSPKRSIKKLCEMPGCVSLVMTSKKNYCAEHVNHYKEKLQKNREIQKFWTMGDVRNQCVAQGHHASSLHAVVRRLGRDWNGHLKQNCERRGCGYGLHVELCHIKPLMSFHDDALLKEVNCPTNILILCPNHHWEFDNNLLSFNDFDPKGRVIRRCRD